MTKTQLLNQFSSDRDQRTLFAHALDKAEQAETRNTQTTSPFLTAEEQAQLSMLLHASGLTHYQFVGGYEGAVRQICCFLPPWQDTLDEIPLEVIVARYYGKLSHSDLLGGLMGIGLTRQKIGDILVGEGEAYLFVVPEVAPIILSQWSSAGREKLTLSTCSPDSVTVPEQKFKEIRDTVATLRLDSVVASGFSLSRAKASALIQGGRVQLNHIECSKTDKLVSQGDVLSCRGLGKCVISELHGQSKKDRVMLTIRRYL